MSTDSPTNPPTLAKRVSDAMRRTARHRSDELLPSVAEVATNRKAAADLVRELEADGLVLVERDTAPGEGEQDVLRERVARAIYEADGNTHGAWGDKTEDGREYWRVLADAALAAAPAASGGGDAREAEREIEHLREKLEIVYSAGKAQRAKHLAARAALAKLRATVREHQFLAERRETTTVAGGAARAEFMQACGWFLRQIDLVTPPASAVEADQAEDDPYATALAVKCPACGVPAGQMCQAALSGFEMGEPHERRVAAADQAGEGKR